MYRKLLLASVGAMALTGSTAFAADLPSRAPPPVYLPPIPIFTWTGIYLGGQVGYAWGGGSGGTFLATAPGDFFAANFGGNAQGVIGGAHVGYNYQINQWVLGLEGSVDGTSLSRTVAAAGTSVAGLPIALSATSRSDIQGSIRGRVGVAWDRALIYATGGVAFAGFNSSITDVNGAFTGLPGARASFSNTRVGWTVGGGVEYAVTNNWSVRAEYRYSNFGNITNSPFVGLVVPGVVVTSRRQLTENQVQVGFSYKFDTWAPAPIVAKY